MYQCGYKTPFLEGISLKRRRVLHVLLVLGIYPMQAKGAAPEEIDVTTQVIHALSRAYLQVDRDLGLWAPATATLIRTTPFTDNKMPMTGICNNRRHSSFFSYTTSNEVSPISFMIRTTDTDVPPVESLPHAFPTDPNRNFHNNSSPHNTNPIYTLLPTNLDLSMEQTVDQWVNTAALKWISEPTGDESIGTGYAAFKVRTSYHLYKTLTVHVSVDDLLNQPDAFPIDRINYTIGMYWKF